MTPRPAGHGGDDSSGRARRLTTPIRLWVLAALILAALWSSSSMAPWAAGPTARPWLEDALYYLRFALFAWTAGESLYWIRHWRRHRGTGVLPPLALAWLAVAAWMLADTGVGLDLRVSLSQRALAAVGRAAPSDVRRRAGLLLVDTARRPCHGQAWLWLGRPFGAGTGTNMALVEASGATPRAPVDGAFVFRHANGPWWLAYQNPGRYGRAVAAGGGREDGTCAPGTVVSGHRQGLAFIASGKVRVAPARPVRPAAQSTEDPPR